MASGLGALSGGTGGALSGAAIGSSILPGIGTAIGAGLGGLTGALGGAFGGTRGSKIRRAPATQDEQSVFSALLNQGLGVLNNPYQGFDPISQRARSQFIQQTIPGLAERFTGTGGALSSPAFASQLGQAGAGLEEALAALQSQYGLQNQQNALSFLQLGIEPYRSQYYRPAQSGFGGELLGMGTNLLPLLLESIRSRGIR